MHSVKTCKFFFRKQKRSLKMRHKVQEPDNEVLSGLCPLCPVFTLLISHVPSSPIEHNHTNTIFDSISTQSELIL